MLKKVKLNLKTDKRGSLVEILKEELDKGQVYSFTCKPRQTRGGHYHKRKTETFCIMKGKVKLTLLSLKDNVKKKFIFDAGKKIEKILIPPNTVHTVNCTGKEDAMILAFIDEKYDEKDSDTYFLKQ